MGLVCALLVVVIHLENVPQDIGSFAWSVHYFLRYVLAVAAVPYFFLASGYFLALRTNEPGWWGRAVVKRLLTLGVPYLVWCLVPIILFTLCWPGYESGGECWRILPKASAIRAAFGLNIFTAPEANRPLWYLRALMMLVLVSPLLVWAVRRGRHWTLLALLALYWSVNTWSLDAPVWWISVRWRIVWIFGFSLEGLFYFCVGLFLAFRPICLGERVLLAGGLVGLAVGLLGMVFEMKGFYAYGYPILLSIPFVLMLLWRLTSSARWPTVLVDSSFAVYVVHPIVLRVLNAADVLPVTPWRFVPELLVAAPVAFLVTFALHKVLPRVASVVFGGR